MKLCLISHVVYGAEKWAMTGRVKDILESKVVEVISPLRTKGRPTMVQIHWSSPN